MFDLWFLSHNLASMKQYRYLKVNTPQVGPGGGPVLTLRYTKPELISHRRLEFYRALLATLIYVFEPVPLRGKSSLRERGR